MRYRCATPAQRMEREVSWIKYQELLLHAKDSERRRRVSTRVSSPDMIVLHEFVVHELENK